MNIITKCGSVLLVAALPLSAKANQEPTATKHEQRWTGTVTAVNAQNKTLTGEHWEFAEIFNIGDKCAISTVDNKEAALGDLRAGEKVRIRYQKVEGVLVADRIVEKALRCDGTVRSVDKRAGIVTIEEGPLY